MSGDAIEPIVVTSRQPSPPRKPAGFHALAHWVCTNNPFYVLSAALVFAGLWISFGPSGASSIPWGLAGGIAGYVLLLTATSCLLARYANVWNDIRSMLLLIVMMLVALSLAFDETLTANPERGALLNLGGLAFAVVISETILGYLAIKFPIHYRLPYYLLLMNFFVYPGRVACWHFRPGTDALHWALFGFGLSVAAALLLLLPAARRGRALFARSGTPWPWPLFPWSVFFILTLCACGRAYFLCVSLDFIGGSANVFGPYFLVPIWLVAAFLVLELGLQSRHSKAITSALAMAMLTPLLAVGGRPEHVYQEFVAAFSSMLGATPLYLAICLVIGFMAIATVRRVRGAADLLTLSIVLLGLQHPSSSYLVGPKTHAMIAFLVAAALQGLLAGVRRSSTCALTASLLAVIAVGSRFGDDIPHAFAWGVHALILSGMIIAATFDDGLARRLRNGGWVVVLIVCVLDAAAPTWPWPGAPLWAVVGYPLVWVVMAIGYGWLVRLRSYHVTAAMIGATWLAVFGWRGYQLLRLEIAGLDYLAGGLLCFAVAVIVSLTKAGLGARWLTALVPRTEGLESNG